MTQTIAATNFILFISSSVLIAVTATLTTRKYFLGCLLP